jgi:hypothetical protein
MPILGQNDFDNFFGPDLEMKQFLGRTGTGTVFVLFANLDCQSCKEGSNERTKSLLINMSYNLPFHLFLGLYSRFSRVLPVYFYAVLSLLWIRNPDPHGSASFGNLDPHPDPHPHQIKI